jgi:2',3'-cyclic-nucleotide 2'-phosphodiesterase/3'-nucleotidase
LTLTDLASPQHVPVRVLATSDLHANLVAFDYAADRPSDLVGLTRTASLIRAARAEQPNALLFDCGDLLQGTVLGELARRWPAKDPPDRSGPHPNVHPMIAAMNAIGYDGATLGNHDFDFGFDFACDSYLEARFPVIVSNLVPTDPTRRGPILPMALLERAFRDTSGRTVALRIGVIGLLPPQTAVWDRSAIRGRAVLSDMVESARQTALTLRDRGADIVVALAHTGLSRPDGSDAAENVAVPLASVDGIDAILLGHTHKVFPAPGGSSLPGVDAKRGTIVGKPAVMPGLFGSHLGIVDLLLSGRPGAWQVTGFEASARPIARRTHNRTVEALVDDDPTLRSLSGPFHNAARAHAATAVGRTLHPLQTYFAMVRDSAAMALVAEAQEWWARMWLRGTPLASLPTVSVVSPLKAGGRAGPLQYSDVPAGDLRLRHIDDLYPFPNTFCAMSATGAELRDFLDRAASVFLPITPGPVEQVLFDEDTPGYTFDILHGLTYELDVTRPPYGPQNGSHRTSRVLHLCHNGRPVAPDDRFALLSNSHRLSGTEFHDRVGDRTVLRSTDQSRDILRRFIESSPEIAPVARPTWRFAPAGGTPVVFFTGPEAERHLGTADAPDARPSGFSPNGFLRFRMLI